MICHALLIASLGVSVAGLLLWHRLCYSYADETKRIGELDIGARWRDSAVVPNALAVRRVDARRRRPGGMELRSDAAAKGERGEDGESHG